MFRSVWSHAVGCRALHRVIVLSRGGNSGIHVLLPVCSSLPSNAYTLPVLSILSLYSLQALGQCGKFIQTHLKDAVLVKTPSTVAAVEALLSDEQDGCSSAAIASGVCERLFDDIQVLQKGIQDETCE